MKWRGIVAAAGLAGCAHSDPPTIQEPEQFDVPREGSAPTRLTYDAGLDLFPSFSPDGTLLLYSLQPRDRDDNDRCIGIMPANGGTREEHCDESGEGASRTDALEHPALNEKGDLLYVRYASAIGALIPRTDRVALQMASIHSPADGRTILQLPTTIEGVGMTRVGTIRWSDDATFYFIAEEMTLTRNPITRSFRDTVTVGNGLIRGRVLPTGLAFEAVSGIIDASGFDFSAGRDSIFFTRSRDNRLYAVSLTGSLPVVVYAAPQTVLQPRELRDPVRIGRFVAFVTQDIDLSIPPAFAAGLAPASRLEMVETSTAVATLVRNGTFQVPSFGSIAVQPHTCRMVVEFRHFSSVSFTTDLYSLCPTDGAACTC